ncbi:RNA polymerase sigma factor [bacterium]|nr:RNA polymerase sigma factor [bacterium]
MTITRAEPTDAELIERCLEAKDAFEQLYARHAPAVFGFLRAMHKGDEHAAADSLQETFFRAYKALGRFDRGRPLRPWLFTIASHVSQDSRKKSRRLSALDSESLAEAAGASRETGPAGAAAEGDACLAIMRATEDKLPARKLAAFVFARGQGLSYEEIARIHECSVATVKRDLQDALEALSGAASRLGLV